MNTKIMRIFTPILLLGILWLPSTVAANRIGAETLPPLGTASAEIPPAQSTTGPYPPLEVLLWDKQKDLSVPQETKGEVLLNVPAYRWRHGCGPTALSMVVGYYDVKGFGDLVPGDAWSQTDAVNQMIASGGGGYNGYGLPFPPGQEGHFEDYAAPIDTGPSTLPDAYITAGRAAHPENSLADYLGTSFSTKGNPYGWSWSTEMGSAFVDYFEQQYPEAEGVTRYSTYYPMNWDALVREINAGRPMVFLVDSSGDGKTDHFVTVIGYRDGPPRQYAVWDTWSTTDVRWENFSQIAAGTRWGIYAGWSYHVSLPPADIVLSNNQVAEKLPIGSEIGSFSTNFVVLADEFSYTLVPGSGDADNTAFTISADRLLSNEVFDFDSRSTYSIRVRSTDSNGDIYEESFAINVLDMDITYLYLPMVGK